MMDHARFWQWFETNSVRLQAAASGEDGAARAAAARELADAGEEAAPGLVLEIYPGREGRTHALVVSADRRPEFVDAAKDFVDAAPALAGWNVVAFRSREDMGGKEVHVAGECVGADDVWFRVAESADGLELTLYVRGLTADNEELRGLAAMLFAEHAIGERDMLTLLDSWSVEPLPDAPASAGLRPFRELAEVFDRTKAKKYPPPGQLPLDLESGWATVEGTKDGSPLVGILHLGLRAVAGHPDYDKRLTVGIPFHESNSHGFAATKEEHLAVCDVGDRLTDLLQEGQQSLLAITVSAAGRRELMFYTADAEAALQRLERLRAEGVSHSLETEVERDTFWGLYRSFCHSAGGGEADVDPEEEAPRH